MGTNRWWLLLAGAAVTLIAMVDTAVDQWVMIELFVVGPLIAAARLPARPTASVCVYALALAVLAGFPDRIFGHLDHVLECTSVTITSVFAVLAAYMRTA